MSLLAKRLVEVIHTLEDEGAFFPNQETCTQGIKCYLGLGTFILKCVCPLLLKNLVKCKY